MLDYAARHTDLGIIAITNCDTIEGVLEAGSLAAQTRAIGLRVPSSEPLP